MALARSMEAPSLATELLETALRRSAHATAERAARLLPLSFLRAEALVQPIPPLLRGNPDAAGALYRGRFDLAGETVEAGNRVVFDLSPPSAAFAAALHSFDWLKHLEACGRELPRVQARGLVTDWIAHGRGHPRRARHLDVASRRLISWIRHAPFLLAAADGVFAEAFFASLSRQTNQLISAMRTAPLGRARLDAAIALAYAAVALGGLERARAALLDRLAEELDCQILPDGGHVSRNPAVLVELLLDLMPLRAVLDAGGRPAPASFSAAIERMLPLMRFFLHGDGGLAAFNGVRDPMTGAARAIIDVDDVHGKPVTVARHMGYARLAHGRGTAIVDIGHVPAPGVNPLAQSGPLSFEFSDGPHRVVVNCGSTLVASSAWSAASRRTAAHSTATVGERSASRILDDRITTRLVGAPLLIGPKRVYGELATHETGSMLEAYHDGYLGNFGFLHERRLFLARHGLDFRGEERFLPAPDGRTTDPDAPIAVRFHLHPSIKATLSRDGGHVMLLLPNRVGWRFSARGADLSIEDSVYLCGRPAPRRSLQIVLTGTAGRSIAIKWAFKRIEKQAMAAAAEAEPQLPL